MKNRCHFREIKHLIRAISVFVFILLMGSLNIAFSQNGSWVAPAKADTHKNPYKGNSKATDAGKKLYNQLCVICHGNKGKGDGLAGMGLNPRPSNFTKASVQQQTDGAIYWKMTEGKAPMAPYKEILTEEQRWQLVNFIRSLDK